MKSTKKRFLGFLSLGLVAAMTVFAATIPVPGAKAITNQITDTIQVTVVSETVDVSITDPGRDSVFVHPTVAIKTKVERAKTLVLTGVYTDSDGVDHNINLGSYTIDTDLEEILTNVNLGDYGYGSYLITAKGTDVYGIEDEDFVNFDYVPTNTNSDEDEDENIIVNVDYEPGVVCSADISIFSNGELIVPPSPIHLAAPATSVSISSEYLETGRYSIVTQAYDCPANPDDTPNPLPFPSTEIIDYEKEEDIPVPDTGGFFSGLNISKADYLATALIVFFAFSILSLIIIIKGRKNRR